MNKATRDLRRLCEDVILLDGDQDEAPDLGDMARRAKLLLRGPLFLWKRPAHPPRSPGQSKAQRDDARRKALADLREAVMVRADGRCEWCGADDMRLELHHVVSGGLRRHRESVETCAAICGDCHRLTHRNARAALALARTWAVRGSYTVALGEIQRRLAKVEASAARAREEGR